MWNRQREAQEARERLARIADENEAPNRAPPPVDDPLHDQSRDPTAPKDPLATAAE